MPKWIGKSCIRADGEEQVCSIGVEMGRDEGGEGSTELPRTDFNPRDEALCSLSENFPQFTYFYCKRNTHPY
ncbi:hypothetical protein J6590_037454 [Homalodisca vitripennis]|nr:hypothetical protein J6590_037454 [Homalodisca vitripennis]